MGRPEISCEEAISVLLWFFHMFRVHFVLKNYLDRDIYQKDIEEELNIRSASVSKRLKKLEEQQMIVRERVSRDDRLKKICPTSFSIEMKEKVDEDIYLLESRLTSGISKND